MLFIPKLGAGVGTEREKYRDCWGWLEFAGPTIYRPKREFLRFETDAVGSIGARGRFRRLVQRCLRRIYTKSELAIYRDGGPLPQSFFSKSLPEIFKIAKINFEKHPEVKRLPREKELINTFIFRSCLCYYLLALDWVARGGAENAKPEKHRNDLIDSIFVTFATYFDGFMTSDARASRVYDEASRWISAIQRADANN